MITVPIPVLGVGQHPSLTESLLRRVHTNFLERPIRTVPGLAVGTQPVARKKGFVLEVHFAT